MVRFLKRIEAMYPQTAQVYTDVSKGCLQCPKDEQTILANILMLCVFICVHLRNLRITAFPG
jgi:hypothetical protein